MTLPLSTLIVPRTKDEVMTEMLADAAALGFPATSWQSGSVPRTLMEIDAQETADQTETARDIAMGGLLDYAAGDWLTILARAEFDLERSPAITTQGSILLSCSALAGPYVLGARSIWVSDSVGRRYTNLTAGTIPSGGSVTLTAEAEFGAAAYNVAINSITTMVTPLPGVTVNNPDAGGGTWITRSGADQESDESLRAKCRSRWGSLGTGSTAPAYEYWARTASPEVRRVIVREHFHMGAEQDGHITILLAGDTGTVSAPAVLAVSTLIEEKRCLCAQVHVLSASVFPIVVTGTLFVRAGFGAAALAAAQANIQSLAQTLRIGETVYRSAIIEQAMLPTGAVNFSLTTPLTDVPLAWSETPSFVTSGIVVVEVP